MRGPRISPVCAKASTGRRSLGRRSLLTAEARLLTKAVDEGGFAHPGYDWYDCANKPVRSAVKDLIKQYLDNGISRRQLMTGLSALGMSAVAAKSVAQSLAPVVQAATAPGAMRSMKGTGGALFVQQLKAAGV